MTCEILEQLEFIDSVIVNSNGRRYGFDNNITNTVINIRQMCHNQLLFADVLNVIHNTEDRLQTRNIHTTKKVLHHLGSTRNIHTTTKVLHHLGSTSSGTFTYKWNRYPHKQHFSSFYCSWKLQIAWCTIIQIDFLKLWSRLSRSALMNLWIVCHDGYRHASMQEDVLLDIRGTGVYCNLGHNFWKSICMMLHHAICGFHEQ